MGKTPKWVTVVYVVIFLFDLLLHNINRRAAMKQPPKKSACVKKSKMQLAWQLRGRDNNRYTRDNIKTCFRVGYRKCDFSLLPRKGVGGN